MSSAGSGSGVGPQEINAQEAGLEALLTVVLGELVQHGLCCLYLTETGQITLASLADLALDALSEDRAAQELLIRGAQETEMLAYFHGREARARSYGRHGQAADQEASPEAVSARRQQVFESLLGAFPDGPFFQKNAPKNRDER